ncbi:hypothetical protein MED121_01020 [Marinomonas sp. MED121]|uniref:alkylhydroperoxidase-related (seleno)protein n=1 Tax=Marinomonas sp. MED121 TaxID=314277 RepID=UPI000068FA15|nr:alkylhydroperoxidase-related (seleno)protein [Marinomonas sp. MED121]EAQ64170.1 hypothetical protein MED121_01020 [Marinomonas sp. MED121]
MSVNKKKSPPSAANNITDTVILSNVRKNMNNAVVNIRSDIIDAHAYFLTKLKMPGTWWNAKQRIVIAQAARNAESCEFCSKRATALSIHSVTGSHLGIEQAQEVNLHPVILDLVHRIIRDVGRITQTDIDKVEQAGLDIGHFVEAFGIAVCIKSMDTANRGFGIPKHSLDIEPEDGKPTKLVPVDVTLSEAFVPMINKDQPASPNDDLWDAQPGNVSRALSYVPEMLRESRILTAAHFIPLKSLMNFKEGRTLTRVQLEYVAARVGILNECFYCTNAHTMLLKLSAQATSLGNVNITSLKSGVEAQDSKVPAGAELLAYTDALKGKDDEALKFARRELIDAVGPEGFVDATGTIANFEQLNRTADASGVPADAKMVTMMEPYWDEMAISDFIGADRVKRLSGFKKFIPVTIRRFIVDSLISLIGKKQRT